jgi:RNA-directed DNA polymerase
VHVSEESHSGIVPMNHSNKDGTLVGGEEEGRLLIEENTFLSCTYPTQSGSARVSRDGRVCGQAIRLTAIHPR